MRVLTSTFFYNSIILKLNQLAGITPGCKINSGCVVDDVVMFTNESQIQAVSIMFDMTKGSQKAFKYLYSDGV